MWFETVSIVTVGYGDIYPSTGIGRTIAVFTMLLGVVAIALPVTVVGSTFNATYNETVKSRKDDEARLDDANLYAASVATSTVGFHALSGCHAINRPAQMKNQIMVPTSLWLAQSHQWSPYLWQEPGDAMFPADGPRPQVDSMFPPIDLLRPPSTRSQWQHNVEVGHLACTVVARRD